MLAALLLALAIDGDPQGPTASVSPPEIRDTAPQAASRKPGAPAQPDSPFTVDLSISASKSGAAGWLEFTPSATFVIDSHWSAEAGAPFYLVSGKLSSDGTSHLGIGDVYGNVSLDLSGDNTTFYTTVSIAVPTGSVSEGLGYGQVTWDWSNHVDRTFKRFTPYADVGLGNALDFTNRVARGRPGGLTGPPRPVVGSLFNGEGGVAVGFSEAISLSVSGYVIDPLGQQHSVVVPIGPRRRRTVVPIPSQTDHGLSTSLDVTVNDVLDLSVLFWHSGAFHNNTMTVGAVVHLSALSR